MPWFFIDSITAPELLLRGASSLLDKSILLVKTSFESLRSVCVRLREASASVRESETVTPASSNSAATPFVAAVVVGVAVSGVAVAPVAVAGAAGVFVSASAPSPLSSKLRVVKGIGRGSGLVLAFGRTNGVSVLACSCCCWCC